MRISDARREANRRNAQKSTGPRTQEGKDRSRMNSLKHGLCSEVVRVAEDHDAVDARSRSWLNALKPQNTYHAWLVEEISVLTHRIDRCGRMERRLRDVASIRAEDHWDDDRRSEAEVLAQDLADRPALVVDGLRRTPQGCEWLIDRWAMLARAATRKADCCWSPDQKRLAFDLLGTPAEFRDGEPGEVVDLRGVVVGVEPKPVEVAHREVEALLARRDELAEADAFARSMAEADLVEDPSPGCRTLRRYEATLHRRLRWCVAQVAFESPRHRANSDLVLHHFAPVTEPAPAVGEPIPVQVPEPEPEPTPQPEPIARPSRWSLPEAPHAPFELLPGERPTPDGYIDVPAILARRERKLDRAEARRAARRQGCGMLKA